MQPNHNQFTEPYNQIADSANTSTYKEDISKTVLTKNDIHERIKGVDWILANLITKKNNSTEFEIKKVTDERNRLYALLASLDGKHE